MKQYPRLQVTMYPALLKRLSEACKRIGITKSAFICLAVDEVLKRRGQ